MHWPLFDLRLRRDRLELRVATDADLMSLGDLAATGIHDEGAMPFAVPWTRLEPPELQRSILQHHWRCRAELSVSSWTVGFVAVLDGEVVGTQDVRADDFPVVKAVSTGSWIGRAHQGQGLGTEMRAAALDWAFAALGASEARTDCFVDNPISRAVTAKLGYELNGTTTADREGANVELLHFRLLRDRWMSTPHARQTTISGSDASAPLLGVRRAHGREDNVNTG